jgi:hypothetical protein
MGWTPRSSHGCWSPKDLYYSSRCIRSHKNIFQNLQKTRFPNLISRDYFNTLQDHEKARIIESQITYQQTYRTLLIKGLKNIDIPTKITDSKNINLSIKEWILQVPDFQQKNLFLNAIEVNDSDVEVQFATNNLAIAQKWTRNSLIHIARVLSPHSYCTAFISPNDDFDYLLEETEKWDPPSPPRIKLMPSQNAWHNPIPSSIAGSSKSMPKIKQYKNVINTGYDSDCNTATTIATQISGSQDILSELQSDSQQHHEAIEAQSRRFDDLDVQVQTRMHSFAQKMEFIEEEHKAQQAHHKKFIIQIDSLAKSLPMIMENIESQQTQIFDYFHQQNNINEKYAEEIKALRQSNSIQQQEISNFKKIINELHQRQPTTPSSLDHSKKKPRSYHPDSPPYIQNINQREEQIEIQQPNLLYQTPEISMIDNINDQSQIDIQHDNFFLPWNDAASDTSSDKKMSSKHSKNNSLDTENAEPGNPAPGSNT